MTEAERLLRVQVKQADERGDEAMRRAHAAEAEVEALTQHGPVMQRGTDGAGNPWMGTMLDVLNDYKAAAEVEAAERRRLAAEVEALRPDAAFVRDLLWNEQPECCGNYVVGAQYMGDTEIICCGCPEPTMLNDAQIVASLRGRFVENVAATAVALAVIEANK